MPPSDQGTIQDIEKQLEDLWRNYSASPAAIGTTLKGLRYIYKRKPRPKHIQKFLDGCRKLRLPPQTMVCLTAKRVKLLEKGDL